MKNDLIERYVYAATRFLSRKVRDDVSREINGLIDDMLTERCGESTPTEKDIRVVLTELGSPQELYEKYSEEEGKCLIGQPYYSTYRFLLKIVLCCVALGMTVASVIIAGVEGLVWYEAIWNWVGQTVDALLSAVAILTILFAVLYHKGVSLNRHFNFDDLPPVPKKKQEISVVDSAVGIGISLVFLLVFLTVPNVFCAILPENGGTIPILDAAAIQSRWYIIVLFSLTGIVRDTVKLLERRYNQKVLTVTVVCDILSVLTTCWWLGGSNIMNPEFLNFLTHLMAEDSRLIAQIFGNFQYFFMGCILFALSLDAAVTLFKTKCDR